jgi:predicted RNase H-like nuclease (RuvC/YqgF family)
MPGWVQTLITALAGILLAIIQGLQNKKLRDANAQKAQAEADGIKTAGYISAAQQQSRYIDELVKDRVQLSKALDAAHDMLRAYETKLKMQQDEYESKLQLQNKEIDALKQRVEALEHIDRSVKVLTGYPDW